MFFLDGKYVDSIPGAVDALAPGRLFAPGVFETMRTYDGKVEFLDAHLNRLGYGLKVLKLQSPQTSAGLKRIVHQVFSKNPKIICGRLRILVFKVWKTTHCAVTMAAYLPPSMEQYRRGLRLTFIKTKRAANARLANVKSLDYGLFADAYAQAKTQGFDEALLVNAKGYVFEASRANVFIVREGRLMTPPVSSGCLNGITRGQVISRARLLRVPVDECDITVRMVKSAQAIFLTNSLAGIIPAVV